MYILRRGEPREAPWPGPGSVVEVDLTPRPLASHLRRFPARLRYVAGTRPGAPGVDARSLAGADLVRIEARDFGVSSTKLRVDDFRLPSG